MNKKVMNFLNNIEKYLLVILFSALMGLMVFVIVLRYGFGKSVAWIEQLTRLIFVWISFSGISYAAYTRGHLKVEALVAFTNDKFGKYILLIGDVITTIFVFYLSYRIALLTINVHNNGQTFSAMPWMRISVLYLSGVLGLAGMGIRTIQMGIIPFFTEKSIDKDMETEVE